MTDEEMAASRAACIPDVPKILSHQGELMHVPFIGEVFDALKAYREARHG
jgi:hypothetical protein